MNDLVLGVGVVALVVVVAVLAYFQNKRIDRERRERFPWFYHRIDELDEELRKKREAAKRDQHGSK